MLIILGLLNRTRMRTLLGILTIMLLCGCQQQGKTTLYLIGDSTVADYTGDYDPGKDYMKDRYPMTGWGQYFQDFFVKDSLGAVSTLFRTDSVLVDNRARGGRSTRTFFQEGRWRAVYESLRPGDVVLMQFGHNDAWGKKPERHVNVEGYQEFLRLFIHQALEKGAIPIVVTPVARNAGWNQGKMENIHGAYPQAAIDVARELEVDFIDLNQLSMDLFSSKGKEYVSRDYFMNLPAGTYPAYPEGLEDNTHFQPEGAREVAQLVFDALKGIK